MCAYNYPVNFNLISWGILVVCLICDYWGIELFITLKFHYDFFMWCDSKIVISFFSGISNKTVLFSFKKILYALGWFF